MISGRYPANAVVSSSVNCSSGTNEAIVVRWARPTAGTATPELPTFIQILASFLNKVRVFNLLGAEVEAAGEEGEEAAGEEAAGCEVAGGAEDSACRILVSLLVDWGRRHQYAIGY